MVVVVQRDSPNPLLGQLGSSNGIYVMHVPHSSFQQACLPSQDLGTIPQSERKPKEGGSEGCLNGLKLRHLIGYFAVYVPTFQPTHTTPFFSYIFSLLYIHLSIYYTLYIYLSITLDTMPVSCKRPCYTN